MAAAHINAAASEHAQKIARDRNLKNAVVVARRIGGDDSRNGTFVAMDNREGRFRAIGDPFFIRMI